MRLSFQVASTVSSGFSGPKSKVLRLAFSAPADSSEPPTFGYFSESAQTGRSGCARPGSELRIPNGSDDACPASPPTDTVMVNDGTVSAPVLRTPIRSSEVSPRRCLVGNSARTTLTSKGPASSFAAGEEGESSSPQAPTKREKTATATPTAPTPMRERRPCLGFPRGSKAAGT